MSAYMVSHTDIDALLTAGLAFGQGARSRPLRWLRPATAEEIAESQMDASVEVGRGEMLAAPRAMELYERRVRILDWETADRVGVMLLVENARSVGWRYDESELDIELETALYTFKALPVRSAEVLDIMTMRPAPAMPNEINPALVSKMLDHYQYQACEHPDWESSEARAFCVALTEATLASLHRDSYPWGCDGCADGDGRDIFIKHPRRA